MRFFEQRADTQTTLRLACVIDNSCLFSDPLIPGRRGRRKLDCCDVCLAWDRSIEPLTRSSIARMSAVLKEAREDYWERWRTQELPSMQRGHRSTPCVTFVTKIIRYVETHKDWDGRGEWRSAQLFRVHETEAKVLHQLKRNWAQMKEKASLLKVVTSFGWHFTCRDRQRAQYAEDVSHPQPGTTYIHLDFAMNRTLPLGDREGGRWWYAGSRTSITHLGVYVWGEGAPAGRYFSYMSEVMDHTPDMVIAIMTDLFQRLGTMSAAQRVVWWADVGNHFRAYRSWAYMMSRAAEGTCQEVVLGYSPAGPGKGRVDGLFGKLNSFVDAGAHKRVFTL